MHRARPVQHRRAGLQLHRHVAAAALDLQLAPVIVLRRRKEQREGKIGAQRRFAHQRVIDMTSVFHAGLVQAQQRQRDALRASVELEHGV